MSLASLQQGALIRWKGYQFRVEGPLPDKRWLLQNIGTGLLDNQPELELLEAIEIGELIFIVEDESPLDDGDERFQEQLSESVLIAPQVSPVSSRATDIAANKVAYIKAIETVDRPTREEVSKLLQATWKKIGWPECQPPAYSTALGWRTKAKNKMDPFAALRDRHDKKGRRGFRYHADVYQVLRNVLKHNYMRRSPRISITKASGIAADKVRLLNATLPESERHPLPGRKAFISVLREEDAYEVDAARYGVAIARQRYRHSMGGVPASRPLERMELDHTRLSVILLEEDFTPFGRPYLTAAIDNATAAVMGLYWGAEPPSIVSVARCIRNALLPKIHFLKKFPSVNQPWVAFGVADSWVLDNGLEEHAAALRQAGSEVGVQKVEFCERASPWQKPNIERYLRSQDQGLLHLLPGATMENILTRTDFDPARDLLIRRSTFDELIVKWVVDVYMQTPLHRLGERTPTQAWQDAAGSFHQLVPTKLDLLQRLFLRMEKGRSLDHEGVLYDHLVYNSMDLLLVRERFGHTAKVDILVNDEDLGFIHVGVPKSRLWVRVPCLDPDYANGLTRWQHGKFKQAKSLLEKEGRLLSLAQARLEILKRIDEEQGAVKQGRKVLRARLTEKSPGVTQEDVGGATEQSSQMPGNDLLLEPDQEEDLEDKDENEAEDDFEVRSLWE